MIIKMIYKGKIKGIFLNVVLFQIFMGPTVPSSNLSAPSRKDLKPPSFPLDIVSVGAHLSCASIHLYSLTRVF